MLSPTTLVLSTILWLMATAAFAAPPPSNGACAFAPCKPSVEVTPNGVLQSDSQSELLFGPAPSGVTIVVTGGDPTGNTDSTGAFTSAISALGPAGGTVYVPVGTYKVRDVTISTPITLVCSGKGATVLDYSGANSFGIAWIAPGFPAFNSNAHVKGGGVYNCDFNRTTGNTTGIIVEGYQDWYATHLVFNTPYNGIFSEGNEHLHFTDISMYGTVNTDYNFFGDLSGRTAIGAPCTTGNADCSTRTDFVTLHDLFSIDNGQTNTCLAIRGFVATFNGGNIACEGPNYGINISCQAGLDPNLSQCPHFVFLDNFQSEFCHTACLSATDYIDLKFSKPYLYGDISSSNLNDIFLGTVNYGTSTVIPGKAQFIEGLIFASYNDCVMLNGTMTDIKFIANNISGCNTSNGGFGGAQIVTGSGGMSQVEFGSDTFCQVSGYAGAHPSAYGIKVAANTAGILTHDSTFFSCLARYASSSSNPQTNTDVGNAGPHTFPTLGSCGGGTPTITGSDGSFSVTVGTGSPASCTVNFANTQIGTVNCAVTPSSGSTVGVLSLTSSPSSATISGVTAGGFSAICRSNTAQ